MKTSLSEIIETEKYLRRQLTPEKAVVFEARLLVNDGLKRNTFFHRMVHRLVTLYHRKELKAEAEAVHRRLFDDDANRVFRETIMKNFNA